MMTEFDANTWDRLSDLFEQVVKLPTKEHDAFLEKECCDNPALLAELKSLLQADQKAENEAFLDESADWSAAEPSNKEILSPDADPRAGTYAGAYLLEQQIGHGGMGLVYKARDERLQRPVAVKFLLHELSEDEKAKERFFREARAVSLLDHTNICTIYDIGEMEDGRIFIAMAFYDGETLKTKIKKGPIDVDDFLDLCIQITAGMERAHEARIIHRDIKPDNVIITERGDVKILDFGIAKLEGESELTKKGTRLGTAPYMSPEQMMSESLDHRTDIWSLGVMMHEMLSGEQPFQGKHAADIAYSILKDEPPLLSIGRSDVSEGLARTIQRLICKNADERFQSMDAVHFRLLEIVAAGR